MQNFQQLEENLCYSNDHDENYSKKLYYSATNMIRWKVNKNWTRLEYGVWIRADTHGTAHSVNAVIGLKEFD